MGKVGDRVKEIRKASGEYKTLEKFGAKIGLSKTAISDIENGRRNLTEQSFKSICREFDVNPSWLRDGSGEMFVAVPKNDLIESFVGDILANEPEGFRTRLITALAKMDEKGWKALEKFCKEVMAEEAAAEKQRETEREKLHEELDRQLDLEESTRRSSGSSVG